MLIRAFRTTPVEGLLVILGIYPLDIVVSYRAAIYWVGPEQYDRVYEITGGHVTDKRHTRAWKLNEWQSDWDSISTARRVYSIFPDIRNRLRLRYIAPTRGMVHLLTGHGPYPKYLHRFKRSNTPICECGNEGTADHVVLSYRRFQEEEQTIRMRSASSCKGPNLVGYS